MNPHLGPVMVPPGGFLSYKEGGFTLQDITREGLIKQLRDKREGNHHPIGDPARDVDAQLVAGSSYGAPIQLDDALPKNKGEPKLIQRLNAWLANRYARLSVLRFVNQSEARRRSSICIGCNKNRKWQGCVTCSKEAVRETQRRIDVLAGNHTTPFAPRLNACAITGQSNQLAVFLEKDFLNHRIRYQDQLPDHCWLKHLESL